MCVYIYTYIYILSTKYTEKDNLGIGPNLPGTSFLTSVQ